MTPAKVVVRPTLSIGLAIVAGGLAFTAAAIGYARTGEIDLGTIAAGIAIPAIIISVAMSKRGRGRDQR